MIRIQKESSGDMNYVLTDLTSEINLYQRHIEWFDHRNISRFNS